MAITFAIPPVAGGEGYAATLKQNLNADSAMVAQNDLPAATQGFVVAPTVHAATSAKPAGKAAAPSALPQPTAIDTANTVNKLLAPRPSDPNVPLPQGDLAQVPSENAQPSGTRFYGRNESQDGVFGGVLGLKIPIPATGGVSGHTTTSGASSRP